MTNTTIGHFRGGRSKPRISRTFSRLPRAVGSASVPAGDRAALVGSAKIRNHQVSFLRQRLRRFLRRLNAGLQRNSSRVQLLGDQAPQPIPREPVSQIGMLGIIVPHLREMAPLSALGLREFADFENQPARGITYLDTYFLWRADATDESLHFHELVHVVQWQVLGPKDFLLLYAAGLAESGYRDCRLEAMAYDHQRRFDV